MTNQASENLSKENILWGSVFWRKLHNCIQVIRRIGKWNTLMSSFSKLSLESHWIFLQLFLESLKTKMTNLLILCTLCVVIYDVPYDCYFTIDCSIISQLVQALIHECNSSMIIPVSGIIRKKKVACYFDKSSFAVRRESKQQFQKSKSFLRRYCICSVALTVAVHAFC